MTSSSAMINYLLLLCFVALLVVIVLYTVLTMMWRCILSDFGSDTIKETDKNVRLGCISD